MKKHLFIAFAAAGLLASCSSNDDDFNAPGGNQSGINENEPAEILIGVGAQASVATRGTGSVGATHNTIDANNWAKQIVNVFMFNRFSFELAKDADGNDIYNDAVFMTPATGSTGVAHHLDAAANTPFDYETEGYKRSYYPMNGNFSFWAYRVDDANGGTITQNVTPGSTTYNKGPETDYNPVQKEGKDVYVDEVLSEQNALATETNWKTQADVVAAAIDADRYKAVYTNNEDPATYSFTQGEGYVQATNAEGEPVYAESSVSEGDASVTSNWKTAADICLATGYVQLYEKVTAPVITGTTITAADDPAVVSSSYNDGKESGNVTVPFTIDGTQDVLSASTYLTAADTMALAKNTGLTRDAQNTLVLEGADSTTYASYAKSLYSAKTARQNVQPNLLFKHMLTRFTFNAAAMQPNFAQGGDDEIRIKDIKIYSRKNGQLVAKYEAATASKGQDSVIVCNLVVDQSDKDNPKKGLSLQKRATGATESAYLVALTEGTAGTPFNGIEHNVESGTSTEWTPMGIAIVDKSAADWTALGEALLVMPNDSVYEMDITIEQTVYGREDVDGNGIDGTQEIKEATIKGLKIEANKVLKGEHATSDGENAGIQKFLAGHSYNVRVQVYGLSKIKVTTTLEPWEDGGHVDIDPDDQF